MKATYVDGQTLYLTRAIPGGVAWGEICIGDEVTIIESYSERGSETRYLVKKSGTKVYVYESDLSTKYPW